MLGDHCKNEFDTMSDSLSSNLFQLEGTPNELLLEIFQYVNPIDLRSFEGLNKRINCIIQALKVNIVVRCQEKDEFNYLSIFTPTQIVRLEIRNYCLPLKLNVMTELRSFTLDCTYLSNEQLDQITKIRLLRLEWLSIENVTYDLRTPLLDVISRGEHFPSLKTCQIKSRHHYNLENNDSKSLPNNALRSLAIDTWHWSQLDWLLHQLPNLRRFETNFGKSYDSMIHYVQPHLLITYLKITLNDPLHDLETFLKWTPNLTRLRIRGKIRGNDVLKHFEKMAEFLSILVPRLQHFDCELYCYTNDNEAHELIIRQLHPIFSKIRCLSGRAQNKCYATDIMIYPVDNEYECE
ncbi:unnamed protein product [Rotaria socialis]|uniref:F-box domain-containing protein n=1 Tax=Rotaria socialis TaxID=392032 RepID=A0A820RXZ9_9BILA|nr:unnamed protein product [Rotaria socialis]CAF4594810.1 unnamed protein product [Rotaria socialis]CAF4792556.1 unnamed protein product [Rotaria socialis]